MILAELNLGDLLWTMIVLFFLFIWILILIQIFSDLFRDHETSGGVKALWVVALIFFTPITALIYLIVNGRKMAERQLKAQKAAEEQMAAYVKNVGGGDTPAHQIEKAKQLLDSGAIDQAEYDKLKAKALS